MKKLILLIAACLLLITCNTVANSKGTEQLPLVNTNWTLNDNNMVQKPTLVFESNRVSGNAGCNNYFGDFISTSAGKFSVSNIGSTKKACPELSAETTYLNILQKANNYVATSTSLELYQDKLLLLKFTKMP